MKLDAYAILIILSILVVLSYAFNFLSAVVRVPSVLLLIASGIGLKQTSVYFGFDLPPTQMLLEVLGITGLILIVLEASLDLDLRRDKLPMIGRAFLSAFALLAFTAGLIAVVFAIFYETNFKQALLHAIPFSIISSAIAIPSVRDMNEHTREFVVYESTFSDILGIILFNIVVAEQSSGLGSVLTFGWDIILIVVISIISTSLLIFLLNHSTSKIRFFLAFAILILVYSLAKSWHLPSLVLVLVFGLVLNNFHLLDHALTRRLFSFERIKDISEEIKVMTMETAFIIRTFFFLLFGYSINLALLVNSDVIIVGLIIMVITLVLRFVFLHYIVRNISVPLALIAPRGLITVLLFYSIPVTQRLEKLSEGVLFIVIVFTSLSMTIGLLLKRKDPPQEKIEDVI